MLSVTASLSPAMMLSPMPSRVAGAALIRIGLFCAFGTLALIAPFAGSWMSANPLLFMVGSLYLIPQALGILLPFALILVVDHIGLNRTLLEHDKRRTVTQFTLLGVLLLVILMGWVIPNANQSWRELQVHARSGTGPVARGLRELTVVELLRRQPTPVGQIWQRLFLMFLPLLLVVFRWNALRYLGTAALSRMWIEIPWIVTTTAAIAWIQLCGYTFGLRGGMFVEMTMACGILLTAALVMSALCNARVLRERSLIG